MEEKELETELIGLAEDIREENSRSSLIPSTLKILQGKGRKISPLLRLTPSILTILVFFTLIYFFSFTGDPVFNIVKIILLIFSFTMGSLFIFNPEKMSRIDTRIIGNLLNRGSIATPLQERVLFRAQGLYFILIAYFVCRL